MQRPIAMKDRLIFALDCESQALAESYVEKLEGVISFFKVGLELNAITGLKFVEYLKGKGHRVFLDIKIPDDVNEQITRTITRAVEAGADFLTIHGNGKTAMLAREAKGTSDLKILFVTLLTSMDVHDVCDMYLIDYPDFIKRFETLDDFVYWKAQKALASGCDGLISSGQNVPKLRDLKTIDGQPATIVCPGIRPTGFSHNEHKRATTPSEAIQNGADYLVVGRPIKNASDPLGMAMKIIEEMESPVSEPSSV